MNCHAAPGHPGIPQICVCGDLALPGDEHALDLEHDAVDLDHVPSRHADLTARTSQRVAWRTTSVQRVHRDEDRAIAHPRGRNPVIDQEVGSITRRWIDHPAGPHRHRAQLCIQPHRRDPQATLRNDRRRTRRRLGGRRAVGQQVSRQPRTRDHGRSEHDDERHRPTPPRSPHHLASIDGPMRSPSGGRLSALTADTPLRSGQPPVVQRHHPPPVACELVHEHAGR